MSAGFERDHLAFRRDALEAEGLRFSPSEAQMQFWKRHNLANGRAGFRIRRPVAGVGDLTGQLLNHRVAGDGVRLGRAIVAWKKSVPANCLDKCRIDSLKKGELTVLVDSKSTAYVLRRQEYQRLLERLEDAAPGLGIQTIKFRVGSGRRANK
ncbi:MAG: DUF721 domain-containing protein [Phycisphaerales bacterium]|nr:DUF721 domain-containing protein [Phycisphaerales bacterium]